MPRVYTERSRRHLGGLNPFRTAVPFGGQTTRNLTGLSPKRDCGAKRVNVVCIEAVLPTGIGEGGPGTHT